MASLGSFGRKREPLDLDFDFFGETIRVHPMSSDLVELDFLEKAQSLDLADLDLTAELTPENMARMSQAARVAADMAMGSVRQIIHPDDWELFKATAIANGQNLQDLMEVQRGLVEAIAGFPTGPSSGSSSGAETTGPKSAADSSSPAPTAPTLSQPAIQALRQLGDRPDLQVAVLHADTAREVPASA
ncbi:hypothetical protein [Catenuloplanes atrovinosus]|uniref:Uncharacterized protein n=1 Tax=Catenuloplanes atrovinosus TaxID=137266 RepID=A0AAE4CBS5_9ACTN|nr:hypothetical protein [Catenuloplanes atrovinosus]MDR7278936.1 hypothetical protein [Catenuloplanes atrovinosus]